MTHVEIVIAVRTPDPAAFAVELEAEARRLAAEVGVAVLLPLAWWVKFARPVP